MPRLVLASQSPRRRELLEVAGFRFFVRAKPVEEARGAGEGPVDYARRLACDKAEAAWDRADAVVLGADTIVVVNELILGKPRDSEHAVRMLRLLSGRQHEVITGVCLAGPGFVDVQAEITQVVMSEISEKEIKSYVESGEPMDKAGSYAIQGMASRWVTGIQGNYFNVVGLPVSLVYQMLKKREAL